MGIGGGPFGGVLNNLQSVFARVVGEDGADAVVGFVGGDGGGFDPGAVRVGIKVVAGDDGLVHSGEVDAGGEGRLFAAGGRSQESSGEEHRDRRLHSQRVA